jgi:hypothetical protein
MCLDRCDEHLRIGEARKTQTFVRFPVSNGLGYEFVFHARKFAVLGLVSQRPGLVLPLVKTTHDRYPGHGVPPGGCHLESAPSRKHGIKPENQSRGSGVTTRDGVPPCGAGRPREDGHLRWVSKQPAQTVKTPGSQASPVPSIHWY